jgi:hypothetical protein
LQAYERSVAVQVISSLRLNLKSSRIAATFLGPHVRPILCPTISRRNRGDSTRYDRESNE